MKQLVPVQLLSVWMVENVCNTVGGEIAVQSNSDTSLIGTMQNFFWKCCLYSTAIDIVGMEGSF